MSLLLMIHLWVDAFWLYIIIALILKTGLNWQSRSLKKFPLTDHIRYLELEINDEQRPSTFKSREYLSMLLIGIFMLLGALGILVPFFIIAGHALPQNLLWLIVPLIINAIGLLLIFGLASHYAKPSISQERQRYQSLSLTTQSSFYWRKYFSQYVQLGWLLLSELASIGWLFVLIKTYLHRQ